MTELLTDEALVVLTVSPSLEETVIDWLLSRPNTDPSPTLRSASTNSAWGAQPESARLASPSAASATTAAAAARRLPDTTHTTMSPAGVIFTAAASASSTPATTGRRAASHTANTAAASTIGWIWPRCMP